MELWRKNKYHPKITRSEFEHMTMCCCPYFALPSEFSLLLHRQKHYLFDINNCEIHSVSMKGGTCTSSRRHLPPKHLWQEWQMSGFNSKIAKLSSLHCKWDRAVCKLQNEFWAMNETGFYFRAITYINLKFIQAMHTSDLI